MWRLSLLSHGQKTLVLRLLRLGLDTRKCNILLVVKLFVKLEIVVIENDLNDTLQRVLTLVEERLKGI